eukprot:3649283-Pleurochrysis_carterae.AAC.1
MRRDRAGGGAPLARGRVQEGQALAQARAQGAQLPLTTAVLISSVAKEPRLCEFRRFLRFARAPRAVVPISAQELELAHEDAIRELKQENDKNITKLRQQYEREVRN